MSSDINLKKIRFGLGAIKGLGDETVQRIIEERKNNGKFSSLSDFAHRISVKLMNKKTLEALAFSGAFDEFGDRGDIVASLDNLAKFAKEVQSQSEIGQMSLFGNQTSEVSDFKLKSKKAKKEDILQWERLSMGLFVSDHPLKGLSSYFSKYGSLISDLTEDDVGEKKVIHGIIVNVKKLMTKKGKPMVVLVIEDTSSKIELALFPKIYEKINSDFLILDNLIKAEGKVDERNGTLNFIVDTIKKSELSQIQSIVLADKEIVNNNTDKEGVNLIENQKNFSLQISKQTTKTQVEQIKELLRVAKTTDCNENSYSVTILFHDKEIKLPFLINYSKELENDIQNILC